MSHGIPRHYGTMGRPKVPVHILRQSWTTMYYGPHSSLLYYGPHSSLLYYGPHSSLLYYGPHSSLLYYGPHSSLLYYGPRSSILVLILVYWSSYWCTGPHSGILVSILVSGPLVLVHIVYEVHILVYWSTF